MFDLTGVSLQFKDSRVEHRLAEEGLIDCEIFHSPIQSWLFLVGILSIASLTADGGILMLLWKYPFYTIPCISVSYLFAAFSNNSFAFTSEKLIVINPNFPFQRLISYDLKNITQIKIDKSKHLVYLSWLFCISTTNYVEVYTKKKVNRFYCSGLDVDCYDENWTEKTLDDLYSTALSNEIKVIFNLN